jgi:hypothetical protein
MNTNTDQNIIQRLKTAAAILEEHCQYDGDEGSGEDLARITCHDAAALIQELGNALKNAYLDLGELFEQDPEMEEQLCGTYATIKTALAKLKE